MSHLTVRAINQNYSRLVDRLGPVDRAVVATTTEARRNCRRYVVGRVTHVFPRPSSSAPRAKNSRVDLALLIRRHRRKSDVVYTPQPLTSMYARFSRVTRRYDMIPRRPDALPYAMTDERHGSTRAKDHGGAISREMIQGSRRITRLAGSAVGT